MRWIADGKGFEVTTTAYQAKLDATGAMTSLLVSGDEFFAQERKLYINGAVMEVTAVFASHHRSWTTTFLLTGPVTIEGKTLRTKGEGWDLACTFEEPVFAIAFGAIIVVKRKVVCLLLVVLSVALFAGDSTSSAALRTGSIPKHRRSHDSCTITVMPRGISASGISVASAMSMNLANDRPETVTRLTRIVVAWHENMPADNGPMFAPEPVSKPSTPAGPKVRP
jgi:hypothetical protein